MEAFTSTSHYSDQYRNKVVVAPMVRVCSLPFRLLALDYGADFVYSEETVDWKLLRSVQQNNEVLGTTDWVDRTDGTVFLRTCAREKKHLVVQLGTGDAGRALQAAMMVQDHVAAVDVNMGCPKEFSLKGGMGAALLTQPKKIQDILTTLVKGLKVPVTCKIRILPTLEATLQLCQLIERCGVAAIAVHARKREERPRHPNHNDVIVEIAKIIKIPIIANGGSKEICKNSDILSFRNKTGASSVMIARAAMWNCSILRPEGFLPLDEVIQSYLKYCIKYDNPFTYTKYTVQNMLRDLQESNRGRAFLETQTMQEIVEIWGLSEEYESFVKVQQESGEDRNSGLRKYICKNRDEVEIVYRKEEITGKTLGVHMPMHFVRGNFCNADLPKMVFHRYITKNNLDPVFNVNSKDRFFLGFVDLEGIRYETTCIEKSRRYAEQAAALVYLHTNKLVEPEYGYAPSAGARQYQHLAHDKEKTPRYKRQQQQAAKEHMGRNRRRDKGNKMFITAEKSEKSSVGRSTFDDTNANSSTMADNLENKIPECNIMKFNVSTQSISESVLSNSKDYSETEKRENNDILDYDQNATKKVFVSECLGVDESAAPSSDQLKPSIQTLCLNKENINR